MRHEGIWSEYRPTYMDGWGACKRVGDLVRCRDCKFAAIYHGEHEYREPLFCAFHDMDVKPENFCSWGKAKGEQS